MVAGMESVTERVRKRMRFVVTVKRVCITIPLRCASTSADGGRNTER